ncbi:nucleotidyltransferase domain-containing protein [Hymenobacter algoricola]|uniref:Polymerase beta nucleotidyltransferase domain-containing protein n=1 Tax=Hymenobacter algoricola TaxID=486267 RepID=A0ABP7NS97_9BACT
MHLTEQQLETIRTFFRTQPVLKAYLFGSYARGEANAESDVDLLVDIDYSKFSLSFFSMYADLARILNKKVDIVSSRGLHHLYRPFIEADKRLVYERGPN